MSFEICRGGIQTNLVMTQEENLSTARTWDHLQIPLNIHFKALK